MSDPLYPHINRRRSRAQFILLAVLFFAPFLIAYCANWFFPDWSPQGRVNYGQLITPVRPVPELALRDAQGQPLNSNPLRGKWTLVQLATDGCNEACLRELVLTRQTWATFAANRDRVQRLLIAADGVDVAALKARLGAEQPDLQWLLDAAGPQSAAAFFAEAQPHGLMLVDPLGNWLMVYPHAADEAAVKRDFKGLQKDINKLLRLSSID